MHLESTNYCAVAVKTAVFGSNWWDRVVAAVAAVAAAAAPVVPIHCHPGLLMMKH